MSRERDRMSVWLDDRRPPPDDAWEWVKTPAEAISLLETGYVDRLSLHHDLGIFEAGHEVTGNAVVLWLEEAVAVRDAQIRPLGGGAFTFQAKGTHVNLSGKVNPVPVGLVIGSDFGNTTATAKFMK